MYFYGNLPRVCQAPVPSTALIQSYREASGRVAIAFSGSRRPPLFDPSPYIPSSSLPYLLLDRHRLPRSCRGDEKPVSTTPLFASLTSHSQLTENTGTLSPFLATHPDFVPVSPVFATHTKTAGVWPNSSHSGTRCSLLPFRSALLLRTASTRSKIPTFVGTGSGRLSVGFFLPLSTFNFRLSTSPAPSLPRYLLTSLPLNAENASCR